MKKILFFLMALPVFAFPCTSILVGKDATTDGSMIIARNSDHSSLANNYYIYHKAGLNAGKMLKSTYSKFSYPNAKKPLGYASFESASTADTYGSAGFNDLGIGMSGTESIYSSEDALKADPMLKDGITEDFLVSVILPRIHSAKEGATLLGDIITKQGTAEGMGVSFIDKKEVWYLETGSGHRWLAIKLPKDQYFVSGNQGRFRDYDPQDKENYMASPDLVEFAQKNNLIKTGEKFNFVKAYIKQELNDVTYNHPRVYYLQGLYTKNNSNILSKPLEFPVFAKPTNKLSVEDVKKGLRMHYNNGLHDPYQEKNPKEPFRPASIFRTEQGHILQIRPNLPEAIAHITYIAWGMGDLSTFVPFYKGAKIPSVLSIGAAETADKKSGYWKFRRPQTLAMQNYVVYAPIVKEAYAKLEKKETKEMKTFEAKYMKNLKSSPAKAQKMLDAFQAKLVKDALKTADDLENTLMTKLTNDTETLYKFHGL